MGTDSRMWQYGSQHQQQYDNLQNKTLICVITLLIVVLWLKLNWHQFSIQ